MKFFQKIMEGIDVAQLNKELEANADLWNANTFRKDLPQGPHSQMADIWVRYNDFSRMDPTNPGAFNDEHVPVWYPAWDKIPALKPIIHELMNVTQGEMLGGVLITKIPAGMGIGPHVDRGWHVEYYDKFYLSIQSQDGCVFFCKEDGVTEGLTPKVGEVWLFDNRKLHWVENTSQHDRITLIVCIRTEKYGRV